MQDKRIGKSYDSLSIGPRKNCFTRRLPNFSNSHILAFPPPTPLPGMGGQFRLVAGHPATFDSATGVGRLSSGVRRWRRRHRRAPIAPFRAHRQLVAGSQTKPTVYSAPIMRSSRQRRHKMCAVFTIYADRLMLKQRILTRVSEQVEFNYVPHDTCSLTYF